MSDLAKIQRVYTITDVINKAQSTEEFYLNLDKISRRNLRKVEYFTRYRSGEPIWHSFRKHCISGTLTKAVIRDMDAGEMTERVRKRIRKLYVLDLSYLENVRFGIENEDVARRVLLRHWRKSHPRAQIQQYGIQFAASEPFLAYSVDGILQNESGERYVVEIKCAPSLGRFKIRNRGDKLRYLDNSGRLRRTHTHMFQVQYYMWVTGIDKCIFFIYARRDFTLEIIEKDLNFVEKFECMKSFYLKDYIETRFCTY